MLTSSVNNILLVLMMYVMRQEETTQSASLFCAHIVPKLAGALSIAQWVITTPGSSKTTGALRMIFNCSRILFGCRWRAVIIDNVCDVGAAVTADLMISVDSFMVVPAT